MLFYKKGKLTTKGGKMMKEKYYVNITNGSISKDAIESEGAFGIYADQADLGRLQEKVNNMDEANRGSYIRAHQLYYPQHLSPENSRYDKNLKALYSILRELGDETTRAHIDSIDVLNGPGDDLV